MAQQTLEHLNSNLKVEELPASDFHVAPTTPTAVVAELFEKHPELQQVTTITLWQSLRCMRLALWDERKRKLVRFREALRPR